MHSCTLPRQALTWLIASLLAYPACADTLNPLPEIEVKAHQLGGASLVSGATRTPSTVRETPQALSVVSQEDLRTHLAGNSKEALEYLSSVVADQGEGRRDEFYLRGFYSPRETLLDGVRDDSLYQRDLATTERLEVIKGPAAAVEAGASYRDLVEHRRYLLAPSLDWKLTPRSKLLLQAEVQREDRTPDRGIPALNGRPLDVPAATFYGEKFDYTKTDADMLKARFEHQFNDSLMLSNTLQYSRTELDGVNTRNRRVNADQTLARQITYFPQTQRNRINQTELSYALPGHMLLVGLELGQQSRDSLVQQTGTAYPVDLYRPRQVLSAPVFSSLPTAIDSRFEADTAALYLQDQISLTPQWEALLGARFDRFQQRQTSHLKNNALSERNDHLISPRLGLAYRATPQQSLYLNLSRSHQPAGGDLLYTGSTALSAVQPLQTDLQEIGYKLESQDHHLYTSIALFRIAQSNQLTVDPGDPAGLRQLQVGRQRNQGLEIEAQAQLASATRLSAGYTYNDARIVASNDIAVGNRAEMTPAHNASLWLRQTLRRDYSIGIGALLRSEQYALSDNSVRLPGYARVDMVLGYTQARYDLSLRLNNIGNTRYIESANNNVQLQPGAPFTLKLVFNTRF
ncbi:MAG: TonB-dependent receptor [Burkholderiales bacterium]|nr:TonB-dependent receptor [Burkholderiales bacterium]